MVRIIVGVVVGFVAWSVLWLVTNQVVQAAAPGAVQEDGSIAGGGVPALMHWSSPQSDVNDL